MAPADNGEAAVESKALGAGVGGNEDAPNGTSDTPARVATEVAESPSRHTVHKRLRGRSAPPEQEAVSVRRSLDGGVTAPTPAVKDGEVQGRPNPDGAETASAPTPEKRPPAADGAPASQSTKGSEGERDPAATPGDGAKGAPKETTGEQPAAATQGGDDFPRGRLGRRPSALKLLQLAQLRFAPHVESLSSSFVRRISPPQALCEPRSTMRIKWNLVGFCLTIYCAVTVPFRSAFGVSSTLLFLIDLLCDTFFLADMYLNFHTGVMYEGILVLNKDKCVQGYLKKWFAVDLLSMLPLDDILRLIGIDVTFWDRFARILRISRFGSYLAAYEMKAKVPALVRLTKLLLLMFLLIHWTACIYFCLSLRVGLGEDDFVPPARFATASAFSQYVHCLYFSTSALTGTGNVNAPENDLEVTFGLCCMVVGFLMFATIVGNIGEVLADMHRIMSQFRQKMDLLQQYMKHRGIPREIQERIRVHYDYLADRKQVIDERTILDDLPMYLRREIAVFLNYETLMKVGIFKDCEPGFINSLALKLKAEVFSPDEYIIRKNEIGAEMYFISKGQVEVVDETGKTIFATLGEGTYFGEVALLLQERRTASVRAKTFCDLFSLNKVDFDEVLEDYPLAAEKMLIEAQRRLSMLKNSKSVRLRKRWRDVINLVINLNKFKKARPKAAAAVEAAKAAAASSGGGPVTAEDATAGARALPQRRMGRMRSSTISTPAPLTGAPLTFGKAAPPPPSPLSLSQPASTSTLAPAQPLTLVTSTSAPPTPTMAPGTLFIRQSDDSEEQTKRGTPPSRRRSMSVNTPPPGMPPLRRQITSLFNTVDEEGGEPAAGPPAPIAAVPARPLSAASNSSAARETPVGRRRSTSLSSMANAVSLAKGPPVPGSPTGASQPTPGLVAFTEAGPVVVPVVPVVPIVAPVPVPHPVAHPVEDDVPSPLLRKTLMKSSSAGFGRKRGQSVSTGSGAQVMRRRTSMDEETAAEAVAEAVAAAVPSLKRSNSVRGGAPLIRSRQSSGTNVLEGAVPVAVLPTAAVAVPPSIRARGARARSSSMAAMDVAKMGQLSRSGSGVALVPLANGAMGAVQIPKRPVRRNSKSLIPDVSNIKPTRDGSSTEEELVSDMSSEDEAPTKKKAEGIEGSSSAGPVDVPAVV